MVSPKNSHSIFLVAGSFTRQSIMRVLATAAAVNLICGAVSSFFPGINGYLHCFCHQNPTRSFAVDSYHFGLCARCSGFYAGIVVSFLLFRFYLVRCRLAFICVPLAMISIFLKYSQIDSPNMVRFGFGLSLGVTAFLIISFFAKKTVVAFTNSLLSLEESSRKINSPKRP